MAKLEPQGWLLDFVLLLNRAALGLYLFIAGLNKVRGGVGEFVRGKFAQSTPEWLPAWFATPYGYAVPWGELVVGATLVLGLFGRISALLTFLLITSFTIAQGAAAMRAPDATWASFFRASSGVFNPNFIMIALALLLLVAGPGRFSLDRLLFGRAKTQPAGSAA